MEHKMELIRILFVCSMYFSKIVYTQQKDFCESETFSASCGTNEVIMMDSATYGRMELGRCILRSYGSLGCRSDAIHVLDRLCSGLSRCEVLVSNAYIDVEGPCPEDLLRYLQASYTCKSVFKIENRNCKPPYVAQINERSMTFVSDQLLNSVPNCIQTNKPWIISTNPGQHLNVTLVDLTAVDSDGQNRVRSYGRANDLRNNRQVQMTRSQRYRNLIVTESHQLEVVFDASPHAASNRFAIEVQVLGCADMIPPDGAWMTRDGDVMEVGCLSGKHSWTLTCANNQWVGAVGQCGSGARNIDPVKSKEESPNISINVMVFGVCSLVLLASSIVFLIGVLILRRKRSQTSNLNPNYVYHPTTMHPDDVKGLMSGTIPFQHRTLPLRNDCTMDGSVSLDYKSLHRSAVQ